MGDNGLNFCGTMEELKACLMAPCDEVPTFQQALWEGELPLDSAQQCFLSGNLHFFGTTNLNQAACTPQQLATNQIRYSKALEDRGGVDFNVPFLLKAVCVIMHVEPFSVSIDGNMFYPLEDMDQYIKANKRLPISLREMRYSEADNDHPIPDDLKIFDAICPADLVWGGPTWKLANAFLQAYRLSMSCPGATIPEIVNEKLVDVGHCCVHPSVEGFSETDADIWYYVRRMNERLKAMHDSGLFADASKYAFPDMSAVVGYFVPVLASQDPAVGPGPSYDTHPLRSPIQKTAFGQLNTGVGHMKWYELPVPRMFKAGDKIRLQLEQNADDAAYLRRMLSEMSAFACFPPVPDVPAGQDFFQIVEAGYTAYSKASKARVVGGQVRLGIGLKGYVLDEHLCACAQNECNGTTTPQVQCARGGTASRELG